MMFKPRNNAPKIQMIETPQVVILPDAFTKMRYYVECTDTEVGWLGTVEKMNNIYLITDTLLFDQEVNSVTCEITPQGLTEIANELLALPNGMEIVNSIRLWGHSHVNMGVSPSGQDDTQMTVFAGSCEYFLRVIANKKGEMEFSLYDYNTGVVCLDVPWQLHTVTTVNKDEIEAELKAKVRRKVYTPTKPTGNVAVSPYYQNGWDEYGYGYSDYGYSYGGYRRDYSQGHNVVPINKSSDSKSELKKTEESEIDGVKKVTAMLDDICLINILEADGTEEIAQILLREDGIRNDKELVELVKDKDFLKDVFEAVIEYFYDAGDDEDDSVYGTDTYDDAVEQEARGIVKNLRPDVIIELYNSYSFSDFVKILANNITVAQAKDRLLISCIGDIIDEVVTTGITL